MPRSPEPTPDPEGEPAAAAPAASLARSVLVIGKVAHHNGADVAPAVITRVWSADMVNVTLFPDGYAPRHATSVTVYADEQAARQACEGDEHKVAAYWPPRV